MKRVLATLLLTSLLGTCANKKWDRLEQPEKDHFTALKVWMDAKDQKAWLKLKTREERDAWLRERGLWDRFYQFDDRMRQRILEGKVATGWPQEAVLMAWGPAHNKKRLAGRDASRSEVWTYWFEVTWDGRHLLWTKDSTETQRAQRKYRMELILDDAKVTEIKEVDGWN